MASTLNCPSCGASVFGDEMQCRYCSSRLARVACPACFGTMFVTSRFCPHCGGVAEQSQPVDRPAVSCPDCKIAMDQHQIGQTVLHECAQCAGFWIDLDSFRRICADRELQSDVLGGRATPASPTVAKKLRYRGCPQCGQLMNRYNFANASKIVIDTCKGHGVWCDRDELRQIVEFIRAGGMEIEAQRESEHRAARKRWLESRANRGGDKSQFTSEGLTIDDL